MIPSHAVYVYRNEIFGDDMALYANFGSIVAKITFLTS